MTEAEARGADDADLAVALASAREQQAAVADILRVISRSPKDLQAVFDVIATSARRFCSAEDAMVALVEHDRLVGKAHDGAVGWVVGSELLDRQLPAARCIVDGRPVHVRDMQTEASEDFRSAREIAIKYGIRTVLATPMLHDGKAIGSITLRRTEVRPFTDDQIELARTFADQAVIAIENVRLFNETNDSLEQQIAMGDVLNAISRATSDVQPVFDAINEHAARLCQATVSFIGLVEGDHFRVVASRNPTQSQADQLGRRPLRIDRATVSGRSVLERRTIHVRDVRADPEYGRADLADAGGYRTTLAVPLLRDDVPIGTLALTRLEVRAFTDREIQLVETFAAQAVIAIENVRLFNETKESLDQQTALSDVLRTISRSAFDLDAVLQTIVERAVALVGGAESAAITRRDGDEAIVLAGFGSVLRTLMAQGGRIPVSDNSLIGRALLTGKRQYIADTTLDPSLPQDGPRTRLVIPFLRDGRAIGTLGVSHTLPKPIGDREMQMLETFADQAAIAIENVRLFNETREGLERQTALGEVLRATAASPGNIQPVLDAVAANAARLLDADDVLIARLDGAHVVMAAHVGEVPVLGAGIRDALDPGMVSHRAILEARAIHVPDLLATADFPKATALARRTGQRTSLAVPLLREGTPIGAILIRRTEVRPFTEPQVQVLQAFGDQAAIAIENVRLFNETKASLERQTALAEILRVIADSPADQQPVVDAVARNTTRYCGAVDAAVFLVEGNAIRRVAHHGPLPSIAEPLVPIERGAVAGRAVLERRTVHLADVAGAEADDFPITRGLAARSGHHGTLATPMMREGRAVGVILLRRIEMGGFSPSQIQLVEAFADQAVIAIENVRLFNETREALERQTAISEILRAIAASQSDERPVLDAIAKSAVRYCAADDASVVLVRDGRVHPVAHEGPLPNLGGRTVELSREGVVGRAVLDQRVVHLTDVLGPEGDEYPVARALAAETGQRAMLVAPMIREGRVIGAILLRKSEPIPFTAHQRKLVEAFADQAVIAIENVRLFNETKEALERETATSSILSVISRSPADQQPTLDAIVESGARLCDAEMAFIYVVEQDFFKLRAGYKVPPAFVEYTNADPIRVVPHRGSLSGRVVAERRAVQIPDVLLDAEYSYLEGQRLVGYRSMLNVPMFSKGELIGLIGLWRTAPVAFSAKQIDLMSTFADQAVIAIENTRLFNETKEALAQQTAVGDVLKTISRSAFDLEPVLDIVLNNAVRMAGADIGWLSRVEHEQFTTVAYSSEFPESVREELVRQRAQGHIAGPWVPLGTGGGLMGFTLAEGRTVHLPDVKEDPTLKRSVVARLTASRTVVGVPMIRDGRTIGGMVLARYEVRPFGERELELVQTFADQAAIAIENVRLFDETKEALEQQSAISEVLKTISGTVFELKPTLQTVVQNAAKLADADLAWMSQRSERDAYTWGARYARTPELARVFDENFPDLDLQVTPSSGQGLMSRLYLHRRTIALPDIEADPDLLEKSRVAKATGVRSVVGVPIVSESNVVGAIILARREVRPFSEREVRVVETFADQAAIAIRNVRLFNEIQDKSRELEVASRHKSEFLANMSHELRTPLNAIIGFSEVLVQGLFGEVNAKQREYLQDVIGSGQHLLSLINDILDLAKIEAGRMELELSTFSFRSALQSGVTIVRERAARNGITLDVDVSDELDRVEADERKVKQILYNLLSNAVKFTPDGGNVNVTVRRDNGDVRVDVQDNGIGIAEADQARIFEEFQQVGRERSREGTGLGLTLTKRFVELHGGRIWLESAPGQGSTFTFTLPLRQAAPVQA